MTLSASGERRAASGERGHIKSVLFAARSAIALNRLLDVLPVFGGDDRVERLFTLIPGSDFDVEALTAIEHAHARTLPWGEARGRPFDLILASNPKGMLGLLDGPRALVPHGAGFSKAIRGEGSPCSASGLDPAYLLYNGRPVASFYALAHPSQLARLVAVAPQAAKNAEVVGDPTLERILASRSHRDRYRTVLGTGGRKLVVLASTWGPESLLQQRPTLPADLATRLPHDAYQLALITHPNARSEIGSFNLTERLAPALEAGMILAAPHEEWAAMLVAADAVITDHGSTALYAAALDRPLIGAYDGSDELIPGSPMDELLARNPRLDDPAGLAAAISAYRPGDGPALAESVFAGQGQVMNRLRGRLYELLGLTPLSAPAAARLLPAPTPAAHTPNAFAVRTTISGAEVKVERFPAHGDSPAHHLAAEHGLASERQVQSAGLIYCRTSRTSGATHDATYTSAAWVEHVFDGYPACRTAAAILTPSLCVAGVRAGSLLSIHIEPCEVGDRVVRTDPAAVLSAVHALVTAGPDLPDAVTCVIGDRSFRAHITPATPDEAGRLL